MEITNRTKKRRRLGGDEDNHDGREFVEYLKPDIVELSRRELLVYDRGLEELDDEDEAPAFRLGYTMGSNKVSKFWDFFSSCYNTGPTNTSTVTCAKDVYSYSLFKKSVSIPIYIAQAMEGLTLRRKPIRSTGGNHYYISGKDTAGVTGVQKRDDLATSVICAVVLFGDIQNGSYTGRCLRLEPHQSDSV